MKEVASQTRNKGRKFSSCVFLSQICNFFIKNIEKKNRNIDRRIKKCLFPSPLEDNSKGRMMANRLDLMNCIQQLCLFLTAQPLTIY
jgi:hypothetical protein